ncbi:MAG: AMP-binding protein [Pseudomonadota bacterium]
MDHPGSKTLGDFLDEMASRFPENEAIVFKEERYTYKDFQDQANRIAKGLIKLGLKKGDKVATLINNRPEWLFLAFGVAKAGGIYVPLSTFYRSRELKYALGHCEIKMLFTIGEFLRHDFLKMVRDLLPGLDGAAPGEARFEGFPDLQCVVSLDEKTPGTYLWEDILKLGEDIPDAELERAQSVVKGDDLVYILLTSGTTAHPKAVQLLHHPVIENPFNIGERQHFTPEDRLWVAIPVFYGMFSTNAMTAMMGHGGTMVIQEFFDPAEALRLIEKERCTIIYGFYNMLSAILNHPDRAKRDLSSVRTGSTIGKAEEMRLMAELAPKICHIYGLTESYGNSHLTDSDDPMELKCQSPGKPLPGFDTRVADMETGETLPPGEIGELCLKGHVTPAYFKDPENNEKAFDKEGWFHTGDLVRVDEENNMYFVSRLKEMLKVGGINVSPATVENYLMSNPKIKEVHVIGYPDEKKDEVVMAVVELKKDEKATEEEIIQFCKGKIASYCVPAYVHFLDGEEWPKTSSGKVPQKMVKELIFSKLGIKE